MGFMMSYYSDLRPVKMVASTYAPAYSYPLRLCECAVRSNAAYDLLLKGGSRHRPEKQDQRRA